MQTLLFYSNLWEYLREFNKFTHTFTFSMSVSQQQVVSTKIEVNRNYVGNKAFQAYQMVASSQIMNVRFTFFVQNLLLLLCVLFYQRVLLFLL